MNIFMEDKALGLKACWQGWFEPNVAIIREDNAGRQYMEMVRTVFPPPPSGEDLPYKDVSMYNGSWIMRNTHERIQSKHASSTNLYHMHP